MAGSAPELVNSLAERYHAALQDPLSTTTRRVRRSALALSIAGIALVHGELIPTRIPAFGLDLTPTNQKALAAIAAAAVVYSLFAMVIYFVSDLQAWRSLNQWIDGVLSAAETEHRLLQEWSMQRKSGMIPAAVSIQIDDEVETSRRSLIAAKAGFDRIRPESDKERATVLWRVRTFALELMLPVVFGLYATYALVTWTP